MKGKEKCKALKEIRRKIAEENDIAFVTSECTYQGECKGTCPKCEAELKYLETQLAAREKLGKAVALVGISAGLCSSLTACSPMDTAKDIFNSMFPPATEELAGDVEVLTGDVPMTTETYEGGLEEFDPNETTSDNELAGDVEMIPEDETTEESSNQE